MLKPNTIVSLPNGLVASVVYILNETAVCRWIGSSIHFNCPVSSLRTLGENPGPIAPPEIDLEALISERNAKAIAYLAEYLSTKRGSVREKKEIPLLKRLTMAKDNPAEFKRLLEENGLIEKNQKTKKEKEK